MVHCAAISGNVSMVRIVCTIWDEVVRKLVADARIHHSPAAPNTDRIKFYQEISGKVRTAVHPCHIESRPRLPA
jgi:hypothetical protein